MILHKRKSENRAGWGSGWQSINTILHSVALRSLCHLSFYCLSVSNSSFFLWLGETGSGLFFAQCQVFLSRGHLRTCRKKWLFLVLVSNVLLAPIAHGDWQHPRHPAVRTPTPEGGVPVNSACAPASFPTGVISAPAGRFPVSFSGILEWYCASFSSPYQHLGQIQQSLSGTEDGIQKLLVCFT